LTSFLFRLQFEGENYYEKKLSVRNIVFRNNQPTSHHVWNTDNPDFDKTDCWIAGYDLTAGGQKVGENSYTSFSSSGTKYLSIS